LAQKAVSTRPIFYFPSRIVYFFFLPILAHAQITGDLEVRVSDALRAFIPDARVGVRNLEMQTARFAASGTDGIALFRQLAPGTYDIKVEFASFSAFLAQAQVQSGVTTTVDVILQIRPSGQRISVSAPTAPVNVLNPQLQVAFQSHRISALPVGTVRGPLSLGGGAILSFGQRSGPGVYGKRRMAQSSSLRRKRKCASLSNRQRLISTTTAPVRVSTTAAAAAS